MCENALHAQTAAECVKTDRAHFLECGNKGESEGSSEGNDEDNPGMQREEAA